MDVFHQIGSGAPDRAIEEEAPASVIINPHSELGKELRKWEQHRTELVPRGTNPGNPYVYRPYPKMLYKAQQKPSGQWRCMDDAPHPYGFERPEQFQQAVLAKESFDRSCQRIVSDESAERIAKGQGWCESPSAAMESAEAAQVAIGNASAEALFSVRGMTEQARAEFAGAEKTTHKHVVDVKGKRKRGRPARGTVAVAGDGPVES